VANARLLQNLVRLSAVMRGDGTSLELQSQLTGLMRVALTYTERQPLATEPSGMALRRSLLIARELLEQRAHESISLDELASTAALSRFHLLRSFAGEFGLPPHAYQIQMRIKQACRLLRLGMPCVTVASSVGFADQSHFTRHFKKIMGVTPRAYAHAGLTFLPGTP
jgi:AraC-like DNA-binding protein